MQGDLDEFDWLSLRTMHLIGCHKEFSQMLSRQRILRLKLRLPISLPRNYATHFERRASLQISAGMGAAPERGEQRAGTSSSDWMSHKIQKRQSTVAVRHTSAPDPTQAASPSHYLHEQAAVSSFTEFPSHPLPFPPFLDEPKGPFVSPPLSLPLN